jgi:hypothetical protein
LGVRSHASLSTIPPGGVHDDKTLDLVRVERDVGVGDHDADVVRDDRGSVEAEGSDDGADVGGLGLLEERPMPRRSGTTTV